MIPARRWSHGLAGLVLLGGLVHAAGGDRPAAGAGPWPVTLGPSADPVGPFAKVRLPDAAFKGDQPHGAALSLRSRKAVVFYLDAMLGQAKKTKIIVCDVSKGTILRQAGVPGARLPFDFDAEGTHLLCRLDDTGTGKKDAAEVWTFAADGGISSRRWVPYDHESQEARDVIWGAFAGSGRVVTLSSGGRLVVWDVATLKRVRTVEASTAIPAVSPNGNYVAFVRDTSVGLLDASTGAVVGLLPLGGEVQSAALAFRADGQALLCAAKDKIILIDPATGRARSVTVRGVSGQGLQPLPSVGWADDRLLFVNNHLVDPEVPVPVWSYTGGGWARPAGGHVWFLAVKAMTEVGLVAVRLPHAGAVKKIVAAHADSSSFLLKPGDSVQVDVRRVPKEHQADARRALEGVLRATEYQPAPNAPLALDVVPGKERFEQRTYTLWRLSPFGGGGANDKEQKETHRFRVQPVEVRLLKDGKEIWQKRMVVTPEPPSSVTLKESEALADKLSQLADDDYGLLTKLQLPTFLQEQMGRGVTRGSLGHSTVGPDGIDEAFTRLEQAREKLDALKKARAKQK